MREREKRTWALIKGREKASGRLKMEGASCSEQREVK